jgi:ABC-type transport system involved in multi-copper enzyme maturation permease subunit
MAAGIFTVLYNINVAVSNFELALSYLIPILVLTVPLLSADAFALEKEQGTEDVLRLLPLRMRDVIFG